MSTFESRFGAQLTAYVALRRGLGFSLVTQSVYLRLFDRYVQELGYEGPLTQELAVAFATASAAQDGGSRRYEAVRLFADYLAAFEPETPRFDRLVLRRRRGQAPAVLFTEAQLATLLTAARALSPRHPLRGLTLYTVIGLAASTGLRRAELSHLDQTDVDLQTGELVVRRTKFQKDRLVVVHASTLAVLREYATRRAAWWPVDACPAFFLNGNGRRLAPTNIEYAFSHLLGETGLRAPGARGPTFHSLRHSFAVQRLVSWYRSGHDVQSLLPVLATYLGHVHYSSTAYYLTATPELLSLAAGRAELALLDEVEQ